MKTAAYRSFVVRAWGRQGHTARALLEEIQTGTRSELRGERAERLVVVLDDLLPPEKEGAPVEGLEQSPTGAGVPDCGAAIGHGGQEVRK